MANLILLNGEDPGRLISVERKVRIGRGLECEVRLEDEQASRVHASLIEENEDWFLEDCESLNGTQVNSVPMDRTPLNSGDLIRIGETLLLFCADTDASAERQAIALSDQSRVRRIFGREKVRIADDPIGSDSTSGPIRKLACLYRLSKQIYQATDTDSLAQYLVSSIQQVLSAKEARVCLRSPVGKFKVYSTVAESANTDNDQFHVLASWVVEKDEALLLDLNENVSWRNPDDSIDCLSWDDIPAVRNEPIKRRR